MPSIEASEPSSEMDMSALDSVVAQAGLEFNPAGAAPAAAQPAAPAAAEVKKEEKAAPAEDPTKKPWEKLEGEKPPAEEKKPVEKAEEKPVVEEVPEPAGMNKAQKDAFIRQRQEIKQANQRMADAQAKLAEAQKQIEEVKKSAAPDEQTLKELEELRTFRAAHNIKSTPEWDAAVTQPLSKVFSSLEKIAAKAGVDIKALEKATDLEESWERAIAIEQVFEGAQEAVPKALIQAALAEADKLHPLYAKAKDLESKAQEAWNGIQNQSEAQKAEAKQKADAEYGKHHDHVFEQLKAKLPSIITNGVETSLKGARVGTDPADQAYAAMSAELLPVVTKELLALRAQVVQLKKSESTLLGTRPTMGNVTTTPTKSRPGADDADMDEAGLNDALLASHIRR